MYKFVILFTFLGATALFSCKNDPAAATTNAPAAIEHATPTNLAGHWIALDFCSRAGSKHSILKAMNQDGAHLPIVYAFTINPDQMDSVTCYTGSEKFKLAARINLDTVELKNANQGKSVYLVYLPQSKDIELFDVTTGTAHIDRFIKSKTSNPNGYMAFTTALNHHLFEGDFTPIGKTTDKPVQFTPGGYILNFADYDRYLPCTGGDCFLLGDQMDVITMATTKVKDSKKMFGFRYSAKGDTLNIYNMIVGDQAKAATLGSVAYRFLRKLPVPAAPTKPSEQKKQQ